MADPGELARDGGVKMPKLLIRPRMTATQLECQVPRTARCLTACLQQVKLQLAQDREPTPTQV